MTEKSLYSVTLNENEKIESNYYVCYERTKYHFFKRNNNVANFQWLFLDRIFGFQYCEGNEPIRAINDGYRDWISNFQENYIIEPEKLEELMSKKFTDGYVAFSLLSVLHSDGNRFNTSVFYEGIKDNLVYYTKTGWSDLTTCLSISFDELKEMIPTDYEGKICIEFLKVPEMVIEEMKDSGLSLFRRIAMDYFGYYIDNNQIRNKNSDICYNVASNLGLEEHIKRLSEINNVISNGKITKRNQLRMHMHIANKMRPTLYAWKTICMDKECEAVIGEDKIEAIKYIISQCELQLQELYKWTSLVYVKAEPALYRCYLRELKRTKENYENFQKKAIDIFKILLMQCREEVDEYRGC